MKTRSPRAGGVPDAAVRGPGTFEPQCCLEIMMPGGWGLLWS